MFLLFTKIISRKGKKSIEESLVDLLCQSCKTSSFDLVQLLFVAEVFYPEKLPDIACAMLENEIDTPAICELAGLNHPTFGDAYPIVVQMFRELGKPLSHAYNDPDATALRIATLVINDKLSTVHAVYIGRGCYWNILFSVTYRNQDLDALKGFKDLYYENLDCNGHIIGGNRNKIVIKYCHNLCRTKNNKHRGIDII